MNREMLDRFYVELTNPDEMGITDSRLAIVFDLARKALAPEAGRTLVPNDLWDDICDFIDDHIDVRDGSDGVQLANPAMHLALRIGGEVNAVVPEIVCEKHGRVRSRNGKCPRC